MNPLKFTNYLFRSCGLIALFLLHWSAKAQLYPITVTTNLVPPSSTYIADFTAAGSEKLRVNILFNDFNEQFYDVRLKVKIQGQGITLSTSANFAPAPLRLYPGSNALNGSDLAEYFNLNNLDVAGINRTILGQTGALPEGVYTFCVQAFDYRRQDVALSREGCSSALLRKNNPPFLITPACGGTISNNTLQNLMFNWQSNADPAIQSVYELTVVDIPPGMNPNDALNGTQTPVLDQLQVSGTTFAYGPQQVDLIPGHRYGYRVRARDPLGLTTFENNGISDACWFYYGMSTAGNITLTQPMEGHQFATSEDLYLSWSPPSNAQPGQQVTYRLKIYEMRSNQSKEDAVVNNTPWFDEETNLTPGTIPYSVFVPERLKPTKSYAWQVKAMLNGELLASSDIRSFSAATRIDKFTIGTETVFITAITSGNLNRFSGRGRIDLHGDGQMVDIVYSDLTLFEYSNKYMVTGGEINSPVQNISIPLDNGNNGAASFEVSNIRIGRSTQFKVNLYGKVKWMLPHPVAGGVPAVVYSEAKNFSYDNHVLTERAMFTASNFELLDPYGFALAFSPSSYFQVTNKRVTLSLNGSVSLPASLLKDPMGNRPVLAFSSMDNPYYLTQSGSASPIRIAQNTLLDLQPTMATIDLSETQSPGRVTADPLWKGVMFNRYEVKMGALLDGSGQLRIDNPISLSYSLDADQQLKSWVGAQGLSLKFSKTFNAENSDYGKFNTFPGQFKTFNLDITDNICNAGVITGFIKIPLLDAAKKFGYTIPLTAMGFQTGYLDEDLAGSNRLMNPNDKIAKMKFTVKQGQFRNNDRLVFTIDMDWMGLSCKANNLNTFMVWGDGRIGFNFPGGSQSVNMANGMFSGYNYTMQSVKAVYNNGLYEFSSNGFLDLGEGITGKTGAPKMDVVCKLSPDPAVTAVPLQTDKFKVPEIKVDIPGILKVELEELRYSFNDPEFGEVFAANGKVSVQKPVDFSLGMNFKMGTKNSLKYWYFGITASKDGGGDGDDTPDNSNATASEPEPQWHDNPLYEKPKWNDNPLYDGSQAKPKEAKKMSKIRAMLGEVTLTGIGGRVYHHMKHKTDGEVIDEDYIPSSEVEYGALLQIDGQDTKTEGYLANVSLFLEMTGANGAVTSAAGAWESRHFMVDLMEKINETSGGAVSQEEESELQPGIEINTSGLTTAGSIFYNIPRKHFVADFRFLGEGIVCGRGHGHIDVDGIANTLHYKFGSSTDRVTLTPGCQGFGFQGWIEGNKDRFNLGLGLSYSVSAYSPTFEIGFAGIGYSVRPWAYAGVAIGGMADITIRPEFGINQIGIWAEARAGIYVDWSYDVLVDSDSGTWTLAEAVLAGNVTLYFKPTKKLKGSLSGRAEILGISTGFDLSFDQNL